MKTKKLLFLKFFLLFIAFQGLLIYGLYQNNEIEVKKI